jgi:BASS family bile acid:Na+ symporter
VTADQVVLLTLQASILLTVFGFGLQATAADVLSIRKHPRLLGRSLLSLFVLMPIVAVAITDTFVLLPSVEAVLLALAISPIPPLLPGRERKAGADGSYGLGLMVVAGLLSIVLVPLTLALLGRYFGRPFSMPLLAIARVVVVAAVFPLITGMVVRVLVPSVAARIAKPVGAVAQTMLVAGVLALLAKALPAALSLVGNGTLLAMAAFMVVGLAAGHWLGGPVPGNRLVLALSTSSRHPAIAFAVVQVNFPGEPNLGAAVVLYLVVSLCIGFPYQMWQRRRMLG